MATVSLLLWVCAGVLFFLTLWLSPHAASEIQDADPAEFKRIGSPNPLLNIHQTRWLRYVLSGEYRTRLSDPKPISALNACRAVYVLVACLILAGGLTWCLR